jgi:putative membrane protein
MRLAMNLLFSTLAVIVAAYLIPGVEVASFAVAFIVAIVLGVLNTFLKPLLILFTLPLTILTLGLFALIINFLLILLAEYLIPGFEIDGYLAAFVFSIVLSLVNSFFSFASKTRI